MVEEKNKGGRPSAHKKEYDGQAYKLCLLGATDDDLANFFEVSTVTINAWKKKHPGFLKALKRGKAVADAKVAESLYKRATGYSHRDVHIISYQGVATEVPITKHYPPDTTACIFWLKNRQKENWRDTHHQELSGAGGGPIPVQNMNIDLSTITEEMLAFAESLGFKIQREVKREEEKG